MRPVSLATFVLSIAVLFAVGCGPELPTRAYVFFDQALGYRSEVVGDPERATARPGERVRFTPAVVRTNPDAEDESQRDKPEDLRALMLVCTAPDRYSSVPVCAEFLQGGMSLLGMADAMGAGAGLDGVPEIVCGEDPFDMAVGPLQLSCVQGTPSIEYDVAEDFEAAGKLVIGAICERGKPVLDPSIENGLPFGCRDQPNDTDEEIPFYATVPVAQRPEEINLNPTADGLQIYLDDEPWEGSPTFSSPTGCEGRNDVHRIYQAEGPAKIEFRYPLGDLETYTDLGDDVEDPEDDEEVRELLELAAHATVSGIQGYYVLLGDEESATYPGMSVGDLEYDPDDDEPRDVSGTDVKSKVVRFWFTLRDDRGGFALVERAACLVEGSRPRPD